MQHLDLQPIIKYMLAFYSKVNFGQKGILMWKKITIGFLDSCVECDLNICRYRQFNTELKTIQGQGHFDQRSFFKDQVSGERSQDQCLSELKMSFRNNDVQFLNNKSVQGWIQDLWKGGSNASRGRSLSAVTLMFINFPMKLKFKRSTRAPSKSATGVIQSTE